MDKFRQIRRIIADVCVVLVAAAVIFLPLDYNKIFGWLYFPSNGTILYASVTFAVLCLAFCLSVLSGRIAPKRVFLSLGQDIVLFGVVMAVAKVLPLIGFANPVVARSVTCGYLCAIVLIILFIYLIRRRKWRNMASANAVRRSAASSGEIRYFFTRLYSAMMLIMLIAVFYLIFSYNLQYAIIPLSFVLASLVFWKFTGWRISILVGAMAALAEFLLLGLHLDLKMEIACLPDLAGLATVTMLLLVPMIDFYTRKEEKLR
ncbi:MAG: hypothetical protein HUJ90_03230 [Bacteroidales bacterium]|nr:hypothetical protein [Bacteroidales bacterium]